MTWIEVASLVAALTATVGFVLTANVYRRRVHHGVLALLEELDEGQAEAVLRTESAHQARLQTRRRHITAEELIKLGRRATDIVVSTVGEDRTERFFAADEIRAVETLLRFRPAIGGRHDRPTDALHDASSYNLEARRANLILLGSPQSNPVAEIVLDNDRWRTTMGCEFVRVEGVSSAPQPRMIRFDSTVYRSPFPEQLERFRSGRPIDGLDDYSLAARVRHPVDQDARVFIFAGICALGTLGAARFLTEHAALLLKTMGADDFAVLVACHRADPRDVAVSVRAVHVHRVIDGEPYDIDPEQFTDESGNTATTLPDDNQAP